MVRPRSQPFSGGGAGCTLPSCVCACRAPPLPLGEGLTPTAASAACAATPPPSRPAVLATRMQTQAHSGMAFTSADGRWGWAAAGAGHARRARAMAASRTARWWWVAARQDNVRRGAQDEAEGRGSVAAGLTVRSTQAERCLLSAAATHGTHSFKQVQVCVCGVAVKEGERILCAIGCVGWGGVSMGEWAAARAANASSGGGEGRALIGPWLQPSLVGAATSLSRVLSPTPHVFDNNLITTHRPVFSAQQQPPHSSAQHVRPMPLLLILHAPPHMSCQGHRHTCTRGGGGVTAPAPASTSHPANAVGGRNY